MCREYSETVLSNIVGAVIAKVQAYKEALNESHACGVMGQGESKMTKWICKQLKRYPLADRIKYFFRRRRTKIW
jgi:hypothetical protein